MRYKTANVCRKGMSGIVPKMNMISLLLCPVLLSFFFLEFDLQFTKICLIQNLNQNLIYKKRNTIFIFVDEMPKKVQNTNNSTEYKHSFDFLTLLI